MTPESPKKIEPIVIDAASVFASHDRIVAKLENQIAEQGKLIDDMVNSLKRIDSVYEDVPGWAVRQQLIERAREMRGGK